MYSHVSPSILNIVHYNSTILICQGFSVVPVLTALQSASSKRRSKSILGQALSPQALRQQSQLICFTIVQLFTSAVVSAQYFFGFCQLRIQVYLLGIDFVEMIFCGFLKMMIDLPNNLSTLCAYKSLETQYSKAFEQFLIVSHLQQKLFDRLTIFYI